MNGFFAPIVAGLFLLTVAPAGAEPLFASGLWPGEGIPNFRAKVDLQGLSEPDSESPPVEGLVIRKGQPVKFTETRFQTVKPALVKIEKDLAIEATDFGKTKYLSEEAYYSAGKPSRLKLNPGDTVNVLQGRAEGEVLFESGGRVYSGFCEPCQGANPETAWWVKTKQGANAGWILIDKSRVEFLKRTF